MRPKLPAPLLALTLLASACATETTDEASDAGSATTHGLLRVERNEVAGAEAEASGVAFAGVVRVPQDVDSELLLRLSGMGLELPAAGQCATPSRERDALPEGELGRAEFLDAGDVLLGATETQTQLAPRAFPSSQTEPITGVVYTSRDRDSQPLPAGARYVLKTTGSDQLAALELAVDAPELLRDVTLAGAPLVSGAQLFGSASVPLTWSAGEARDIVYVEVTSDAGPAGVCAFRDSDGRGELPRGLFGASGSGSLAFHRLREVAADVASLDAAEVRFDFELSAQVTFR